jgi:hypothetical protein
LCDRFLQAMARGFASWQAVTRFEAQRALDRQRRMGCVEEAARRRQRAAHVIDRWQRAAKRTALGGWALVTRQQRQARRVAETAGRRGALVIEARAWARWSRFVARRRPLRRLIGRLLRRKRLGGLEGAMHKWRAAVSKVALHESREAVARLEAELARVRAAGRGEKALALARAINNWQQGGLRSGLTSWVHEGMEVGQRLSAPRGPALVRGAPGAHTPSESYRMMRTLVRRMLDRAVRESAAGALRVWKSFVIAARHREEEEEEEREREAAVVARARQARQLERAHQAGLPTRHTAMRRAFERWREGVVWDRMGEERVTKPGRWAGADQLFNKRRRVLRLIERERLGTKRAAWHAWIGHVTRRKELRESQAV